MNLTSEQVIALAPDTASVAAARKESALRKWKGLGRQPEALWGECQGSALYQVQVDLSEPAFKCSCPSRKFPCKHALALMLLAATSPEALPAGEPPAWVTAWLESRAARAAKAEAKAATVETKAPGEVTDTDAQTKRQSARTEKVAGGMQELELWLADRIRHGLASLATDGAAPFQHIGARLVDAQAGSLGRQLKGVGYLVNGGTGWQDRVLQRLAMTHLLVAAHGKLDSLPPDLAEDVRSLIGWNVNQAELLTREGVRDTWQIVARTVQEEDAGLRSQRVWLRGEGTGRSALILDFAYGAAPLDVTLIPGTRLDAELVFYPGAVPQRALVKLRHDAPAPRPAAGWHACFATLLAEVAADLARQPWLERWLLGLVAACLTPPAADQPDARWLMHDASGVALPLSPQSDLAAWRLLAITGGAPSTIIAEWDGEALTLLSVLLDRRHLYPLSPQSAGGR